MHQGRVACKRAKEGVSLAGLQCGYSKADRGGLPATNDVGMSNDSLIVWIHVVIVGTG